MDEAQSRDLVFLKQYGAQRTGTNLVRALVCESYPEVVVLMHVLGDKHSPPLDLEEHWRRAVAAPDPALAFVCSATWDAPAATTTRDDRAQRAYLQEIARPLAAAFASQRLGFLISIKDPYAWAVSMLRWRRLLGSGVRPGAHERSLCRFLAEICDTFNRNYAAWVALRDRFPTRSTVVRYEELLEDPGALLSRTVQGYGLPQRRSVGGRRGVVIAARWDNVPSTEHWLAFDPGRYESPCALRSLTPAMRDAVTAAIDWTRMESLGYAPVF